jgi:hypothetical protein
MIYRGKFNAVLAFILPFAVLLNGCSETEDEMFVENGNVFFEDAISRLSDDEKKIFAETGEGKTRGFLFSGIQKTCIVLVTTKKDVLLHGPAPAFCYDRTSNEFVGRI